MTNIKDYSIATPAMFNAEAELSEQCRINARGADRELALLAENERLKAIKITSEALLEREWLKERAVMLADIKRLRGALKTCGGDDMYATFDEIEVAEAISQTEKYDAET